MDNYSFFKRLTGNTGPGILGDGQDYKIDLAKAGPPPVPRNTRSVSEEQEGTVGQLTLDIYQTPSDIVVQSAIAGAKPEDIEVSVSPDSISISGLRRREPTDEGAEYIYEECYWGKFARSVILPEEVDPETANVTFKNGILVVRLPKMSKKKTKKLTVKTD